MTTYETEPQDLTCNRCGRGFRARVTILEPAGVAAATCTRCGHTQEPRPSEQ